MSDVFVCKLLVPKATATYFAYLKK